MKIQNQEIPGNDVKFGLGVFVIIFNKDFSKILLLKRNEAKRIKWNADWGNIGGVIESREHSLDACMREAREEINLKLNRNKLKLIKVLEHPDFTKTHHGIHFVYATVLDEKTPIKINSESDGHEWFSVDNLPDRMLDKPEFIKDIRSKAIEIFGK